MSNLTTLALRVIATLSAVGLVVASAGFGAVFAYRVGSQHNELLAVLMIVMALALEGAKPIAIAAACSSIASFRIVKGCVLACLGLVAVAYSLTSELSLMSMSRGDLAAQRQQAIETKKQRKQTLELARRELERLGPVRPSEEVQAAIEGIESIPGIVIDGRPCGGVYDGPVTKEHCPHLVALKGELGRAKRREELEAWLLSPQSESIQQSNVSIADPGSHALATYLSALGIVVAVHIISEWLALVPVLALELGSAFAVVLVQAAGMLGERRGSGDVVQKERNHQGGSAKARDDDAECEDVVAIASGRVSDRKTVEAKLLLHLRGVDGDWTGSERQLAEKLKTSKPTVRRAISSLSNNGAIKVRTSKSGTRLALA